MKVENILIVGGLAFVAYWLFKKNKKIVDIIDANSKSETAPKTIILNLNQKKERVPVLNPNVEKRYNATPFATVSPAMVEVNGKSNFYDF